jgi:hypothetical protein
MRRRRAAALSLCALSLACGESSRRAAERCEVDADLLRPRAVEALQRAGIQPYVSDAEPVVRQRTIPLGDARRIVVAASWGGTHGHLLLADCAGIVLDVVEAGHVREMETQRLAGGRTLLRVRAADGGGAGWHRTSERIFVVGPDALHPAWSGVAAERAHGGAGGFEREGEITHLEPDFLVQRVTRWPLREAGAGAPVRDSAAARTEVVTYRWKPAANAYEVVPR